MFRSGLRTPRRRLRLRFFVLRPLPLGLQLLLLLLSLCGGWALRLHEDQQHGRTAADSPVKDDSSDGEPPGEDDPLNGLSYKRQMLLDQKSVSGTEAKQVEGEDAGNEDGSEAGETSLLNSATKALNAFMASGSESLSDTNEDSDANDQGLQKFYCHHEASCGTRTNPGPPSADSNHGGLDCFCQGDEQAGLGAYCFRGTCWQEGIAAYRTPNHIDAQGACQYTALDRTDYGFCSMKSQEL